MVRPHDEDGVRLDKAVVDRGLATSRTRAQSLIRAGSVSVDGRVVTDKDRIVDEDSKIEVIGPELKWVSRAGTKLEHALRFWKVDVSGVVAIDVGASTGGFTEVLLSSGAKRVYAIDVGHDQLAPQLRTDPRVVSLEGQHINELEPKKLKEAIDLAVVDVSFISLEKVLPKVVSILHETGRMILLIKPQFEVGKEFVGKGVVTDPKLHAQVAGRIEHVVSELGFHVEGVVASPILGGDGNREFLLFASRGNRVEEEV
jgi:23S rRNA (cytidine1920-2'-O)/16S rRNA (cytidine1409-2'-O)-methyltransferase